MEESEDVLFEELHNLKRNEECDDRQVVEEFIQNWVSCKSGVDCFFFGFWDDLLVLLDFLIWLCVILGLNLLVIVSFWCLWLFRSRFWFKKILLGLLFSKLLLERRFLLVESQFFSIFRGFSICFRLSFVGYFLGFGSFDLLFVLDIVHIFGSDSDLDIILLEFVV